MSNGQSSPSIDHIEGTLPTSVLIEKELSKLRFKMLKKKHDTVSLYSIEVEFTDHSVIKIMPQGDKSGLPNTTDNLAVKAGARIVAVKVHTDEHLTAHSMQFLVYDLIASPEETKHVRLVEPPRQTVFLPPAEVITPPPPIDHFDLMALTDRDSVEDPKNEFDDALVETKRSLFPTTSLFAQETQDKNINSTILIEMDSKPTICPECDAGLCFEHIIID